MTVFLGLTGSIGMGKSTTAMMFRKAGVPVFDSDACVHKLYEGEAVALIENAFAGTSENGVVDRSKLGALVIGNETEIKKLEKIIHPLVQREEKKFRQKAVNDRQPLAILDHPLLFEMKRDQFVDGIIVVTAPYAVQKKRVLAREGMSEEKFKALLARQTSDEEKRKQADYIIDSSKGLEFAEKQVKNIIEAVLASIKDNKE